MPEEAKAQSWWQTLPGILTASAGIITAITGLILAVNQLQPLWKSEATGSAKMIASAPVLKGTVSAVSFPLSEARIAERIETADRDLAYKILSASLSQSKDLKNFLTITFAVRFTNNGTSYVIPNARFFRLLADGDAIAPENMPDPFVNSGNSKVLTMTFLFPDTTRSAQLQVGEIDQKTMRFPLSLKTDRK